MSVQVTILGGLGGRSGGNYDDSALKKELGEVKRIANMAAETARQAASAQTAPARQVQAYDDAEIKSQIADALRIAQSAAQSAQDASSAAKAGGQSGAAYDDAALKAEIANLKKTIEGLGAGKKEYQAAYIPRSEFPSALQNNTLLTIPFKTPFSKVPFVTVTLDIKDSSPRLSYLSNVTDKGFDIATNYGGTTQGLWYEAYIID